MCSLDFVFISVESPGQDVSILTFFDKAPCLIGTLVQYSVPKACITLSYKTILNDESVQFQCQTSAFVP